MAAVDADSPPRPITLSRMRVPKASDVLADDLRERILSGEYTEGASLPPERDLVDQTGLSRTTVREALRILEVQGLVRIKSGRAGGAFVQRPGEEAMANTVGHIVRGQQIRLAALLETREAIEPFCARLAATSRTEAQLAALDRANDALASGSEDVTRALAANVDWHLAVARASNNELLAGLMLALSRAIYAASDDEAFVTDELRVRALASHRTITEAIRAKDADAAVRRMQRHIHAYAEEVLAWDSRQHIDVP